MQITVISNLYPPYFMGGYELKCREIVDHLRACGHDVRVITSQYGIESPIREGHVYRVLRDEKQSHSSHLSNRLLQRFHIDPDVFLLRKLIRQHKTELIFVFNLARLSPYILPAIEGINVQKIYRIGDIAFTRIVEDSREELSYWEIFPKGIKGWIKRSAGSIVLKLFQSEAHFFKNACFIFVSQYMKNYFQNKGFNWAATRVIHNGVAVRDLSPRTLTAGRAFRILFLGQVLPHKGVHVIIEALHHLKTQTDISFELTIVGGTNSPEYLIKLKNKLRCYGLSNKVTFTGQVPPEKTRDYYQWADLFVFPSMIEEGFASTNIEAMATGLPVVASVLGGVSEILKHDVNALVYPSGDSEALAKNIYKLLTDKTLYTRLSQGACTTVQSHFDQEKMLKAYAQSVNECAWGAKSHEYSCHF